jgi:hypothetical protein
MRKAWKYANSKSGRGKARKVLLVQSISNRYGDAIDCLEVYPSTRAREEKSSEIFTCVAPSPLSNPPPSVDAGAIPVMDTPSGTSETLQEICWLATL